MGQWIVTCAIWASYVALVVKIPPANAGDIREAGLILEEGMAIHSNIFVWRIPWTEEPGRLWSIVLQRVGCDWRNLGYVWFWINSLVYYMHTYTEALQLSSTFVEVKNQDFFFFSKSTVFIVSLKYHNWVHRTICYLVSAAGSLRSYSSAWWTRIKF